MSAFYDELRADVDEILAELGQIVEFRQYTYVTDLVEGTSVPSVSASQELRAAIVPATNNLLKDFEVKFMDGIQDSLETCFAIVGAEGYTFAPSPKDKCMIGTRLWDVIGCSPLNVDGTAVLFGVGFLMPA